MPYVTCPGCSVLSYIPRPHFAAEQTCPLCDMQLTVPSLWDTDVPASIPAVFEEAPGSGELDGGARSSLEGDAYGIT